MMQVHALSPLRRFTCLIAALLMLGLPVAGWAQVPFPNRPITLVIPFGPGGETDIFARALSNDLAEALGYKVGQLTILRLRREAEAALGAAGAPARLRGPAD